MIRPKTEAELAEAVAGAGGPLCIQGGATRGVSAAGQPLSVSGLSGVVLYEPGALTLVAQAGTPVAEVEAVLAAEHQRLAFEPMDHRVMLGTDGTPTLGGVMAASVSGPRRFQAGAARDFALGVRFVDGMGRVLSNGGRVMKNVTGYDLVKLMCGSFGTLGVLSEVSLKVLPQSETQATLRVHGVSDGLDVMTRAVNSPFEVSGAAQLGDDVLLRVEGFADSVDYRVGALKDRLAGSQEISVSDDPAIWEDIRDVRALAEHPFVWKLCVAPSTLYEQVLPDLQQRFDIETVIDWAGGLCWIGARDEAGALHQALRDAALGGHATLVKGTGLSRFQPEAPAVAAISAGLRQKFDPRGILNMGLMG